LAVNQSSIVITINYRLGPLGFLVVDEASSAPGGFNGIRDMMAALAFTQDIIPYFGGDSSKITVFGESAGGCAVCTLSIVPEARGLFRNALVESGPCIGKWGPESQTQGWQHTRALMHKFNVTSVNGLRGVNASKFEWLTATGGYFMDPLLSDDPASYFKNQKVHATSLVIGATSRDGTSWLLPWLPKRVEDYPASMKKHWEVYNVKFNNATAEEVLSYYPLSEYGGDPVEAFIAADSDFAVACPSLEIVEALTDSPVQVYSYEFAHMHAGCDAAAILNVAGPRCTTNTSCGWASHGSEISFVWGNPYTSWINGTNHGCPFSSNETALSKQMAKHWADIAKYDRPTGDSWPAYDTPATVHGSRAEVGKNTMVFATPSRVEKASKARLCAFWKAHTTGEPIY